ncbi:M23 family metallopeptidase [Halalkalibacter urbisdiaboli]|uniref:M23 family metallopeptidase n=1 Tax=Halalkalibacter urbisdiaboli TaxID=1960589 RepID=UPI000B43F6E1|nr:M23 family metallopeptidase [Halalkalibacter urbisdiaboli]
MREENKKSSKSEETFNAKQLLRKKWFAPSIYLVAAAFVLSAVVFMQGQDESAAPEDGVTVEDPTSQNHLNEYGQDAVPVNSSAEVLKLPVTNADEVEVVGYFYDVNATSEEQEEALVYYNNMYYQNKGIDLAHANGDEFDVVAAMSGTVVKVEQDSLLGNVIEITHEDGVVTHYHSLDNVKVEEGATVKQGDLLGVAGRNLYNKDAGVHVHFELRYEGTPVNPNDLFDQPIDSIGQIVKDKEAEKEEAEEADKEADKKEADKEEPANEGSDEDVADDQEQEEAAEPADEQDGADEDSAEENNAE